jgi:hypothetical protein
LLRVIGEFWEGRPLNIPFLKEHQAVAPGSADRPVPHLPNARSHELDAVFTDDGEDVEEVGEAEEVANLLAEVGEFEATAGVFGGDVEADEGAESHAVSVGEVGEVEDDALVIGEEGANAVEEDVGDAGDEPAVAAHHGDFVGALLHVEGKDGRGGGVGH